MITLTLALLPIVMSPVVLAQEAEDPLIGTWENSYGSQLDISWHNPLEGSFNGTYSSSTGASGKYNIMGVSPSVPSKEDADASQPVAFSILWKPITGAKGSPDEEWTSSMIGQIVKDKSGIWTMEVFHSLNASTPLPAVEIPGAGHYSETLIFKRTSNRSKDISTQRIRTATIPPTPMKNPLQGNWVGESSAVYPSLQISMYDGEFIGSIIQKGVGEMTILGYTTLTAPTGDVQSFAFVFMGEDAYGKICYAGNGFLYQGERIELIISKSRATPYASKYVAVQVTEKAIFYRGPDQAGINIAMQKNNFTNNGASEWTANFSVGEALVTTPVLKFGMDTGGNFSWANSTQCTTKSCTGFGHIQFNPSTSSTFQWIDTIPKPVNWGPWGKAMANLGSDYISFNTTYEALRYNLKLITHFDETVQFDEFLWDGAFALPASSKQMVSPTSNILKNLIDNGQLKPENGKVCVAFYFNPKGEYGLISMGEWDSTLVDTSSKLTFEYKPYSEVPYLWCSPLKSFSIGDKSIASGGFYSFDTGSSALKGDSVHMQETLNYAQQIFKQTGNWPTMHFAMGLDNRGETGRLELNADQYVQLIEEGEHVGERVPQIQTLSGTPNLYLQGSTMMNYVYSVFWWDVHPGENGYDLTAREIWLFNKKNGPQIIKKNQQAAVAFSAPSGHRNHMTTYPNPVNNEINIVLDMDEKANVLVTIHAPQGEMLYKKWYYKIPQGVSTISIEEQNLRRLSREFPFAILIVKKGEETVLKKRILFTR